MNNIDFQNGVALGLAMGGVVESEGVKLNIAYGETAPEDTSKLWVKANEPNNIKIGSDIENVESCIESTGTQYIDTGIIPTNHRVKMKFQCTTSDNAAIFGSYGDKSTGLNYNVYEFVWYNSRWYYAPDIYDGEQTDFSPTVYPTDIVELDFNTYDNKIVMNNTVCGSTYGVSRAVLPLYLFKQNGTEQPAKMKLWYAQIYDRATQTLVRDFVPAKDENGIFCLYDNVTQAYFYNQGEGVFGGGPITHELTQGNIEIKTSLTENKFNLINTENTQVKIGVENVYIGNENNKAELCEAYLHNGTEWQQI